MYMILLDTRRVFKYMCFSVMVTEIIIMISNLDYQLHCIEKGVGDELSISVRAFPE
jgi:hypothetical protein